MATMLHQYMHQNKLHHTPEWQATIYSCESFNCSYGAAYTLPQSAE